MSAALKNKGEAPGRLSEGCCLTQSLILLHIYTLDATLIIHFFLDVFANKLSQKEFLDYLCAIVKCIKVESTFVNVILCDLVIHCVNTMLGYNICVV